MSTPVKKNKEGWEVDTTRDVPSVAVHDKQGRVFIDREANKRLTPEERRTLIIHERVEHSKRIEGDRYSAAHTETERLFPFTPEFKERLHTMAEEIKKRVKRKPQSFNPPSNLMGGAVDASERVDPIEGELTRRRVERGDLQEVSLEDLTDDQLNTIAERRAQRRQVADIKERALDVGEKVMDGIEVVGTEAQKYMADRNANIAGQPLPSNVGVGMVIAHTPKAMKCRRCSTDYPPNSKVFKKIMSYYCPKDGAELSVVKPSATKAFDILARR